MLILMNLQIIVMLLFGRMICRYLRTIIPYILHETCDFFKSVYLADSLCNPYAYITIHLQKYLFDCNLAAKINIKAILKFMVHSFTMPYTQVLTTIIPK